MWLSQPTRGEMAQVAVDLRLNQYLGTFVYNIHWKSDEEQRLVPFLLAGIGAMHSSSNEYSPGSVRLSYGFGGGFKYFFSPHVGLRAQARFSPTHLYDTPLPGVCNDYGSYDSTECRKSHEVNQGDVTVGVIFRFGGR
jgi:opacity protein-like surface antigen